MAKKAAKKVEKDNTTVDCYQYVLYHLSEVCRSVTDIQDELAALEGGHDLGVQDIGERIAFLRDQTKNEVANMRRVLQDLDCVEEQIAGWGIESR